MERQLGAILSSGYKPVSSSSLGGTYYSRGYYGNSGSSYIVVGGGYGYYYYSGPVIYNTIGTIVGAVIGALFFITFVSILSCFWCGLCCFKNCRRTNEVQVY